MIKFYYGTVGSGKSMHLIAEYLNVKRRFPYANVILAKPSSDVRTEGVFTRFGNVQVPVDRYIHEVYSISDFNYADYLFIDEAQFIPEDFFNSLRPYSEDINIFVYGLRNDSNKVMWPSIKWLMNYADELVEMPTTCEACKKEKAAFNKALKMVEDAQNSPGFHFIPVCGACWTKN